MPKLVPYAAVMQKLAAVEAADQWGRKVANWEAAAHVMSGVGEGMAKQASVMSAIGKAVPNIGKLSNNVTRGIQTAGAHANKAVASIGRVAKKAAPYAAGGATVAAGGAALATGGAGLLAYHATKEPHIKYAGLASGALKLTGKSSVGVGKLALRNKMPLAVGAAGLAAYGATKIVPKAVRKLDTAKMQPMAYGGGYSSVNSGYGETPWTMPKQPMGRF